MNAIIIFLKNYFLTSVKTRLSVDTSENFSKNFYKNCIKDILNLANTLSIPYFLYWYPAPIENYFVNYSYSQNGKDLGEKMYNAFIDIFNKNFEKVILIGSDIPQISRKIILNAFNMLNIFDYVLGPCFDGGYYLIGTTVDKLNNQVFKNIKWSTNKVLSETLKRLKDLNYSYTLLEKLYDIDTISDLKIFYKNYKKTSLHSISFLNENFSNNSCI